MNQLRWGIIGCDGKFDRSDQILLEEEDKKQKQFNANRHHHHHQMITVQLT